MDAPSHLVFDIQTGRPVCLHCGKKDEHNYQQRQTFSALFAALDAFIAAHAACVKPEERE